MKPKGPIPMAIPSSPSPPPPPPPSVPLFPLFPPEWEEEGRGEEEKEARHGRNNRLKWADESSASGIPEESSLAARGSSLGGARFQGGNSPSFPLVGCSEMLEDAPENPPS